MSKYRYIIMFVCIVGALFFYSVIGLKPFSLLFAVIGIVFEGLFWITLFKPRSLDKLSKE
ncbi:sodium/proton-translocating pyrophosphatase [Pseudoteredinibacter isoporae]|uniref:Uncharacterized protein n=1 Tax=Pseudoteredinibacter isoporae TaxID=570281 RepID=A0A7X0MWW3_9GAMM|nr:sodium/proton-translocating pyrophosphatase [Pseudoteredinibacter isoporae]MBB6521419.1 hypothetical protein [Pseudoteredinibacter isoporae]NHO86974.1 sodium/proton-translocating pyrophosphatase [Pseudoteredinibacter isoporae]NIB24573.1 sodium/proton-translocating pyrophosphatase [Pseudoteredinibacter isoporae]